MRYREKQKHDTAVWARNYYYWSAKSEAANSSEKRLGEVDLGGFYIYC